MKTINKVKNFISSNKLKKAFQAVKYDMESMEENHNALKQSVNEWIVFLDEENRQLKSRVIYLENKVDDLEEEKLSVLRNI